MSDTKKKSKSKKKKKEVEEEPLDSESSEEELDLTKECHPLQHYMNDRPEMIKQMFSIIKGNKLKAMLPPILKNYDLEDLKLKCLDQLMGMSEKRVTCLLEGEILETSSESEVPSSSESSDEDDSSIENGKASVHSIPKKGKKRSPADSVERSSRTSRNKTPEPAAPEGKTLLEILELEMRARAIRALLKKNSDVPKGDVVDLTEEEFPTVIKVEPQTDFEAKVTKSKVADKPTKPSEDRKRKMMAELELRNKLKKKKTYRTREQRLANMEPEVRKEPEVRERVPEVVPEVRVKEEPIVLEDPEEGEVSSEGEEVPVPVKKEKEPTPEHEVRKVIGGERILAMDDGEFVPDANVEWDDHVQIAEVLRDSPTVVDLEDDQMEAQETVADLPKEVEGRVTGAEIRVTDLPKKPGPEKPEEVRTNTVIRVIDLPKEQDATKEIQETEKQTGEEVASAGVLEDNRKPSTVDEPVREIRGKEVRYKDFEENTVTSVVDLGKVTERNISGAETTQEDNTETTVVAVGSEKNLGPENLQEEKDAVQNTEKIVVESERTVIGSEKTQEDKDVAENTVQSAENVQENTNLEEAAVVASLIDPEGSADKTEAILETSVVELEPEVSGRKEAIVVDLEDEAGVQTDDAEIEETTIVDDDETSQTSVIDISDEEEASTTEKEPEEEEPEKNLEEESSVSEESWRARYLKREDVQRVVKSSKICALVRKKIVKKKKSALAAAAAALAAELEKAESNLSVPEVEPTPVVVEGSVSEYQQLPPSTWEAKNPKPAEGAEVASLAESDATMRLCDKGEQILRESVVAGENVSAPEASVVHQEDEIVSAVEATKDTVVEVEVAAGSTPSQDDA